MAIVEFSNRANLSREYLQENWGVPSLLQNDYISIGQDTEFLFSNDVELQARIVIIEGQIVDIQARLDAVELLAASNEGRLDLLEPRVTQNEADISTNAAGIATNTGNISTNTGNIATNTADIAAINTPSGTGSPEGVVTATRTNLYVETGTGQLWHNPTIGANTGWVQIL